MTLYREAESKTEAHKGDQNDNGGRDEAPGMQDLRDDPRVLAVVIHVHVGVKGHQLAQHAARHVCLMLMMVGNQRQVGTTAQHSIVLIATCLKRLPRQARIAESVMRVSIPLLVLQVQRRPLHGTSELPNLHTTEPSYSSVQRLVPARCLSK